MSVSVDSEEEALRGAEEIKKSRKTGKVQDWSGKNTLKLGEFHRNNIGKKGTRKPTLKKQIRDIERLIEREGIPEEIKNAKKSQLRDLKKQLKKQKEALKFDLKYKKIKFGEKRKLIRNMEKTKKALAEAELKNDANAKKECEATLKVQNDQLTYINHFPVMWKYISLFPSVDTEESKKQREATMAKVLKMAEVKRQIKEKDLVEEAQEANSADYDASQIRKADERVFGKDKPVE